MAVPAAVAAWRRLASPAAAAPSSRGCCRRRRDASSSTPGSPPADRVCLRAGQRRRRCARRPSGALELAIERMRFALGVDEDLTEFARDLPRRPADRRGDPPPPLVSPEAPALALGGARLGGHRAADRGRPRGRDPAPDRSPLGRKAPARQTHLRLRRRRGWGRGRCATSPRRRSSPASPRRSSSPAISPRSARSRLIRCAREIAAGRVDPARRRRRPAPVADRQHRALDLAGARLRGRGDADSLPAGDLAYVKLVGALAGLGRRATVEEVEEYFAPYAPFRGLAGAFALARWHGAVASGPPLKLAA